MAANFESGFSGNRIVPWHGLGEVVKGTLTSADAIHTAGLDWRVNQQEIQLVGGDVIKGAFANVRDKDNSVLGIVSSRYNVVQNEEAFSFTDSLIGGDVQYETAGSLKGGRVVWLLARIPEFDILGDKIESYMCFTNSFDKSSAVRCVMTNVRVVCNNTLDLALSSAKRSWSCNHSNSIQARLQDARNSLNLAEIYNKNLVEEAERLAREKVSTVFIEKMLNELFPKNADASNIVQLRADESRDAFTKCLNADDIQNFKGTKWGIINAVTDFEQHREPLRNTSTYRESNFMKILTDMNMVNKVYSMVKAA